MKYVLISFLWVAMLFYSACAEEKILGDNIEYYTLDNGLQVYLLSDDKAETTRVRLSVAVGYDDETDETYGLTHLVEHLLFRDHRVPHSDYLDYIKEEGGTRVNGYTRRYETGYIATIAGEKSDWLVKTFSKMLFDKELNEDDLRIEKQALQTEIGEPHWYHAPLYAFKHFINFVAPPSDNFYVEEFSIKKDKKTPDRYHAQENNRKFKLKDVMDRYKAYYYPANMKLIIVGKFNVVSMKKTIKESFGKYTHGGTLSIHKPKYKGQLSKKPSLRFYEGASENYAYVGSKYILDDYKKYLILDIYNVSLAERLQQQMRNKLGKTYSVNDYGFSKGNAGVISVSFDGLRDSFSENIVMAEKMIESDRKGLDATMIKKALTLYEKKNYLSIEHDSDTLMDLIETRQYLREEHNITDKSAHDIFKDIKVNDFNALLSKVLTPQNRYKYITRDYYFFPAEMFVITVVMILLFVFVYVYSKRRKLKKLGLTYTARDIVFQRRISSRFMGFLIILLIIFSASLLQEWAVYLLSELITGNGFYLKTLDVPQSYIFTILDPVIFMFIYVFIYNKLCRYWARVVVLKDGLLFLGSGMMFISKDKMQSLHIVNLQERKGAKTLGRMFRFWKPLLKIELKNGHYYYVRSANATHLKEDIEKWMK